MVSRVIKLHEWVGVRRSTGRRIRRDLKGSDDGGTKGYMVKLPYFRRILYSQCKDRSSYSKGWGRVGGDCKSKQDPVPA